MPKIRSMEKQVKIRRLGKSAIVTKIIKTNKNQRQCKYIFNTIYYNNQSTILWTFNIQVQEFCCFFPSKYQMNLTIR